MAYSDKEFRGDPGILLTEKAFAFSAITIAHRLT